jgi:3-oxoacyl-[acyl-carrier-protein] synthase II
MANAVAGSASELRLKGEPLSLAHATHAIGQAFRLCGRRPLMLAGALTPLEPIVVAAWSAMRVLAPAGIDPNRACRPFSRDRQGIVLGEGAGFLVLETLGHARGRGARPLAEVVGYGANADAGHVTHPDLSGVKSCMALAPPAASTAAVGYVNAHGTGTGQRQPAEASPRCSRADGSAGQLDQGGTVTPYASGR